MKLYENFEAVVTRKTFRLSGTAYLNCICNDCHANCTVGRSHGGFFDLFGLAVLEAFIVAQARSRGEKAPDCDKCQHSLADHSYVKALWEEVEQTSNDVDEAARQQFTHASSEKERKESMRDFVQRALDEIQVHLEEDTRELGRIAEEYARLSLSGSFAGQLHKSVKLLATKLESMRNDGSGVEIIARMEKSLERLKDKLRLLERAQRGVTGGDRGSSIS